MTARFKRLTPVLMCTLLSLFCLQDALAVNETFPVKALERIPQDPVSFGRTPQGAVLIDFGRDAFGQVQFPLTLQKDCHIVIHLGEALKDGQVNRNPGGSVRYARYEMDLQAGKHTYRPELRPDSRNTRPTDDGTQPILMPAEIGEVFPFRYCEIEGLPPMTVPRDIVRWNVHYPFNEKASHFHCSDTILNQVWDLCKYSVKATSFCGYYVDGDRERIPYEADALINQLSHYCTDSEYAMARQTIEYLLEHPTWPTEWQMQMVLMAWYDYLYTGDKSLIDKYYNLLKAKTLSALREENGLISTRTGKFTPEVAESLNYRGRNGIRDIVDWPRSGSFGIGKEDAGEADAYVLTDYNTVVNAYHYQTLVLMSKIAGALGRKTDAKFYAADAEAFKETFNRLLFDEENECYKDGIDTGHHSLHANMFPLAFGLVPEEKQASVLEFIRSRGMACSVYGAQFLLEALYNAHDDSYGCSLMASESLRSWYHMIRLGATITLEAWDPCFKPNLDWNHAWGSAPANIIPRRLMGVEPLEPGFKTIGLCPQPGGLKQASALVPSIRGGIACQFERVSADGLYVFRWILPAGVRASVRIPMPATDCAESGEKAGPKLYVNGKVRRYRNEGGFAVFKVRRHRSSYCLTASFDSKAGFGPDYLEGFETFKESDAFRNGSAKSSMSEPACLNIDLNASDGPDISEDFIGLSYEAQWVSPEADGNHYFDPQHKALTRLFKTLGVKSLRMGGNSVDRPKVARPTLDDIDKLFDFAREADCRIIYSLQLLNNTDAGYARSVAERIYGKHSDAIAYMAIGNEPSYYKDYDRQLRPHWEPLQQAISSAAPEARFCGPDDNPNPGITSRLINDYGVIGGDMTPVMALSSMHYYPGDCAYRNPFKVRDNSELIPCDPAEKRETLLADDLFGQYEIVWNKMDTVFSRLPFRLTETNSIWYGGLKDASDSYAAALWALDYMFWWACKGAQGVNFHTGDRVGGGEGIVAASYSAFVRDGRGFDIRPLSYAMKMFDLAGQGQLKPCRFEGDTRQLSAYASCDNEYLWLTIINRQHGPSVRARSLRIETTACEGLCQSCDKSGIHSGKELPSGKDFKPDWKKARMTMLYQEENDIAAHKDIRIGGATIMPDGSMAAPRWTKLKVESSSEGICLTLRPASATIIRIPLK